MLRRDHDAQACGHHVLEMTFLLAPMSNFWLLRVRKVIHSESSPDGAADALDPDGVCQCAQRNHIVVTEIRAGGSKDHEALFKESPVVDSRRQRIRDPRYRHIGVTVEKQRRNGFDWRFEQLHLETGDNRSEFGKRVDQNPRRYAGLNGNLQRCDAFALIFVGMESNGICGSDCALNQRQNKLAQIRQFASTDVPDEPERHRVRAQVSAGPSLEPVG